MKTLVINSKLINKGRFRLDGGFYLNIHSFLSLYLEANEERCVKLEDIADVMNPPVFKRQFCSIKGNAVEYFQSSDVSLASNNSEVYIYRPQAEKIGAIVHEGDILVTGFGSIGNVRLVSKSQNNVCYANNVARIFPKKTVKTGFLYAFLMSKFGNAQLNKNASGSVVRYIEAPGIKKTLVPNLTEALQRKVDDLIQESAKLREEASVMIRKAKSILLNYCNADFRKNNFKTAVVKNTDILFSLQHRIDPPSLINDGVIAINKIEQIKKTVKLKDTGAKVFRPGIFKRCYVSNGYPYIKGSDIFNINPFIRCSYLSRKNTPFVNEMLLHEGQILVTCAGSVGNIKLITKEYDDKEALGSQDIIRIETTNNLFTKEYLFIYLQLPFVYDYIQSMKYGSVIERVEPFHIESIPVVQPTVKISEEITSLVRRYMECTYKAFVEEETAIKEVEQEIESWNKK